YVAVIGTAFIADKIEELVLLDRPADRAAKLVIYEHRFLRLTRGNGFRPRFQVLVAVVFEGRTVYLIRTALDLHVDRSASGQALLRVEAAGDYVDFLDRLERRNIGNDVRQLHGSGAHAVDACIVLIVAGAVQNNTRSEEHTSELQSRGHLVCRL